MPTAVRCFCAVCCFFILFCSSLFAGETSAGWKKCEKNPVLGGELGTCFDITMLKDGELYRMWFSWRPKKSIAYTESKDGVNWSEPKIVLSPVDNDWEHDLNRPGIVFKDGVYHLWYTGQAHGTSKIGYATSKDGLTWQRQSKEPVLVSELPWEKVAVMCPHVDWDENEKLFKMWYSAGEQHEPNAIGYATSPDGLKWTKHKDNPIFFADKNTAWERHKVTAAQILRHGDWYLMFYIGFENEHLARIGIARSKDGLTNWQRHPVNPIISPSPGQWDESSCYKPFVLYDANKKKWRLWYNGRKARVEQIGMAYHDGEDLGFPAEDGETKKGPAVLKTEDFRHYIEKFNADDEETVKQLYPNDTAWDFLSNNMPLLDYPDEDIQRTYYFRWWTFRKHLKKTADGGYVVTEFHPPVSWAGKENTISCPGGHHFREGRWLHDPKYLNDYATFWLRGGGSPRAYSFWIADSIWQHAVVTGDFSTTKELLPDLVKNYEAWEKDRLDPNGLFWQIDDRDGMEVSVGGSGYRVTINSYMFGDAVAISRIAALCGDESLSKRYLEKAERIHRLVNEKLWDDKAGFYKVAPRVDDPSKPLALADVREEHGYTPWYFDATIPKPEYRDAWRQLLDPKGFYAPFGPTTTEQRHPGFKISYEGHECQWNGPSWPFATSVTLTGLANLICREKKTGAAADVDFLRKAYLETLKIYAKCHRRKREDGKTVCWIDENLNPFTGDWISRTRLKTWKDGTWDPRKGGVERGKDYNHSTFCDLVINGLLGFRPGAGNSFEIFPLAGPEIEYFCLDNILWRGKVVTILYDKSGNRYGKGKGFKILLDGREVLTLDRLPVHVVSVPG